MTDFELISIPLALGFFLDSILGDPLWLPHPIRWFGKAISSFEHRFNSGKNRKLKGAFVTVFLIVTTYLALYYLLEFSKFNKYLYFTLATIFVFYGLANRSLITEALKVEEKLSKEGVEAGRKQVGFIVGRDTSKLSENQIRKAVLETLSENLSDGVIAPLFYYAIGGVPLMFAYKMINTLDSMIGYKNDKFKNFGFFSAKLDDLINFIPARITALLMVIIAFSWRGFVFILKFGNQHSSPNAGYPEAALAGILNCQFGGANRYHGKWIEKPLIGENDRIISKKDIYKTALINYLSAFMFVCFVLLF